MKIKKFLSPALLIILLVSAIFVLSSCNDSPSLEERGYTVKVTYDFNGGIVDETAGRVIYYKENSPIIKPGDSNEVKAPVLNSYYVIEGWYKALTDEDGNVLKDEDGNTLTESTPFSFESEKATKSMTLVVKWKECPTVTIKVDGRDDDVRTYKDGDTVNRFTYMAGMNDESGNVLKTFYDYFLDEECTKKASWPIEIHEGDHITLYTKWFDGDVLIVRARSDLSKLTQYKNKTVYLDTDIDYDGSKVSFPSLTDFSGTFIGNGHTIKNITKDITLTKNSKNYGLFGDLKSGAIIENLRFENVNINVKIAWNSVYPIGFLAGSAEEGASVKGCSFENCSLIYTKLASASEASVQFSSGTKYEYIFGTADEKVDFDVTGTVTFEENKS